MRPVLFLLPRCVAAFSTLHPEIVASWLPSGEYGRMIIRPGPNTALRSILLLLCLLLAGPSVVAQVHDLAGVVIDNQSGDPVPYARVTLCDRPGGTNANALGFFLLSGIPPGRVCLSVRALGYRDTLLVLPSVDAPTTSIRVALQAVPIEIGVVQITGAPSAPLVQVQPSAIVINQHELRSMPAVVQVDVFRSLAGLPGVVSTSDVSTQFYVRGGAGDQNAILLDGMRVYSPYHALGLFSIFDADLLREVTVYSGAYPAGYGGRLSSVVALSPRGGMSTMPAVNVTMNPLSAKLGVEGPIGSEVRVVTSGRRSISSAPMRRFLDRSAPFEFYDVFARVTRDPQNSTGSFAATMFLSGDRLRPTVREDAEYSWRNSVVGVRWSGLLADRLYVSSQLSSSGFSGSREPAASLLAPSTSSVSDLTFRTDATVYSEAGQEYLLGFEFSFPTLEYRLVNTLGRSLVQKKSLVNASTWGRSASTSGRWSWDAGVHIDAAALLLGRSVYAIQPRIALSYSLDELWKLKMAYGRYTQNEVTVNNEDDVLSLFDAWIAVPDDMPPEHADHVVVGLSGTAASNLGVDLETYFKRYGALLTYNPEKLVSTDPDFTNGSGHSYGAELTARYVGHAFDLSVSYALAWTRLSVAGITYHPRHDRRHSFKSMAIIGIVPGLEASGRWEYGSGLPFTPSLAYYNRLTYDNVFREPSLIELGEPYIALGAKNSSRLPGFHRLDVALSWRFKMGPLECGVSGSVINVYDRRNIFYVDRQTGRRVNSLGFIPTVQLSATLR